MKVFWLPAAICILFLLPSQGAALAPPLAFSFLSGTDAGPTMLAQAGKTGAEVDGKTAVESESEYGNVTEEEVSKASVPEVRIADPLEKWNRFWFTFNDKLYFWVLKPTAKGYKRGVPEGFRVIFNNFYRNVASPIRIINNLLQLKIKHAGGEFLRLVVNSTVGVAGFRDCAAECFGIRMHEEDFGLTLSSYHVGQGLYVVWPVIGPSTARDTVGLVGDLAADPMYWFLPWAYSIPLRAHDKVNYVSFHLGDYEALKELGDRPVRGAEKRVYTKPRGRAEKVGGRQLCIKR